MDRTNDFSKIVLIYQNHTPPNSNNTNNNDNEQNIITNNKFLSIALKVSTNVNSNNTLLEKVKLLSNQKEFSNDPTNELTEISNIFQTKIKLIQQDLDYLKSYNKLNKALSNHHQQHYTIMTDTLSKNLNKQIKLFQSNIFNHSNNIKQRQSRVMKYGQSVESIALPSSNIQQYAMFNDHTASELRRRSSNIPTNNQESTQSKSPYTNGNDLYQTQIQVNKNDSKYIKENRLSNAKKIENSIAQMGALFTQMASLVMEQSETISRIEDDVEIGYEQTKQANDSMQKFYEISKGNRGMILKIFALLIFFIFLFLVWT